MIPSALPNFPIHSEAPLSKACRNENLVDFHQAVQRIQKLAYGRNSRKDQLACLLVEERGTCSTKHAFLAQLAIENEIPGIQLILGIYQMNANNTPGIGAILEQHQLAYLPEAHNYLNFYGQRIDITNLPGTQSSPFEVLMKEIEITPQQIVDFKPQYHQDFLGQWIDKEQIPYTLEQIWEIREACIAALANIPSKE
ncbi:MAG: hypothetical protein AAF985_25030 [Bacteroidota bacterium]